MPGNLREIKDIEAEVEAAGLRGITKQQILDALRSQAKVGGAMSINGGTTPMTIAAGWNRIDAWERSIDTQGVADGLAYVTDPGGWYRVSNAAAGDYTCSAAIRALVSDAGDYEIRLATVDDQDPAVKSTTPYHDKVTASADQVIHLSIAAAVIKDMGVADNGVRKRYLQLEIKGPNGADVTIQYGQFGVWR